ncbi:uncharacterized protein LOC126969432 isoform X3 [Leptidea sinapis]|uniref:uncharacterized protein LOC126969432 isoform X3 n=1 Tax=Leptidea sinapis TaxID=189913 RepID=UPI0021C4B3FA|nr:uncharacterized protein LOC126969432 isoform X3 [Leptidea sinapis]
MTGKLDQITNREWEQHRNSMSQPPTLPVFITFLNSRADLLETLEESKVAKTQNSQAFNNTKPKSFVINTNNNFTNHKSFNHKSSLCQLCNQSHFLFSCPNFRDLPVESRIKKAQDLKVCLNCLRPGHVLSKCKLGSCKYCRLKHNTLLHIENEPEQSTSQNVALTLNNTSETRTVLLSTALVNVVDTNGKLHTARVLLDNGSTANFVSEDFCHMTKEAFLAALNRFIARRGKPRHIFSDNGSTFVGAFNELAQLLAQDLDLNRIDPGHQSQCVLASAIPENRISEATFLESLLKRICSLASGKIQMASLYQRRTKGRGSRCNQGQDLSASYVADGTSHPCATRE